MFLIDILFGLIFDTSDLTELLPCSTGSRINVWDP